MALRNQPYLPLYVQDFLTDEKLNECSAESTGVFIRLLCIMHKSEEYGTILLKQKDKQSSNQNKNFANKLAKQMPYSEDVILTSIIELLEEGVLLLEGDKLIQKRMVRDEKLSVIRANAGSKGGKKNIKNRIKFAKDFAQAKVQANTENEIEYINKNVIKNKDKIIDINIIDIIDYLNEVNNSSYRKDNIKTISLLNKILKDYTLEDVKKVIDIKVKEWKGTDMEKFIRPETLFGNKFESYFNQKPKTTTRDVMRKLLEEEAQCKEKIL